MLNAEEAYEMGSELCDMQVNLISRVVLSNSA